MIYEKNEHFVMEADKDMIFITVCQKGFSILQLNPILLDFSQIMLENLCTDRGKRGKNSIGKTDDYGVGHSD
ncbi:hypothetical protein ABE132_06250 [Peribacillus simplex]|uniref:hypothetical protein n=1 Tax=Peribacillus simplex TaxID=1478 RepID=UPI003D27EBFE